MVDTNPTVLDILSKVANSLPERVAHSDLGPILPSETDIDAVEAQTTGSLQDQGYGFDRTVDYLLSHVATGLNLNSLSPRYYGFVTGGATPASLAADFLTSIYDQNVQVHLPQETVATKIEVEALNMLLDLLRFDRKSFPSKTFTTGATASNILGLALGREWLIRTYAVRNGVSPVVSVGDLGLLEACSKAGITRIEVVSTMPHSSIAKAASVVGLGRSSIVDLSDKSNPVSLSISALKMYLSRRPSTTGTILVLSAGEVNTGLFATSSVEELQELRALCTDNNIWLHIDAAFGLFARLLLPPSPKVSPAPSHESHEFSIPASGTLGFELADSITGDAHKFLNVPYDCGFFFSRHPPTIMEAVLQNGNAAYLSPSAPPDQSRSSGNSNTGDMIPSPLNIGLENSRRFRALPVYASLLSHGRNGYTSMIKTHIRLARGITRWLLHHSSYTVLPQAERQKHEQEEIEMILTRTFMIVLFRHNDPNINKSLVQRIKATGKMYVSPTAWDGRPAARIAISNWKVDLERDLEIIKAVLEEVAG